MAEMTTKGKNGLPTDVSDLNAIVQRSGIEVSVSMAPNVALKCYVRWRGTETQLRATGLLKRSYRLPLTRGRLWLPHEEANWFLDEVGRPFLSGEITLDSDGARFTFAAEVPLPLEVRSVDGVEICRFSDRLSYYGPRDAMMRAGLIHERQMPGPGKRSKTGPFRFPQEAVDAVRWRSRCHPTGKLIHYRESDEVAAARGGGRVQAKPVLETVVNRARCDADFQRFMQRAAGQQR